MLTAIGRRMFNSRHCYVKIDAMLNFRENRYVINKSTTFLRQKMAASTMNQYFPHSVDHFNCVTIHTCCMQMQTDRFQKLMERSLIDWTTEKRRSVWIDVELSQSDWIPVLVKLGFVFHRTTNANLTLYKWLLPKEEPNIPGFAHTLIGVGAIVINDAKQVLVVAEQRYDRCHWKLPGGYVEPGENFASAAEREVFEETHIKTEFQSLVAMRHHHYGQFNCSDLYIVVAMKALTEDARKSDGEIRAVRWMPMGEVQHSELIPEITRRIMSVYLENLKNGIQINCVYDVHSMTLQPFSLYSASQTKHSN